MTADADYAPLDLRSLRTDLPLTCDLYIQQAGQYVLYREASLPFTAADRARLLVSGVTNLWIRLSQDSCSQKGLAALLALPDELVPPLAKAGLVYGSVAAITRRAIAGVSPEIVAGVAELVGTTIGYLARSQHALSALLSVMAHDYSLYTHAVNVAVYALGLGRFVGITDREDLRTLGLGAILHDVGKTRVPRELLDKPGPLLPEEWAIMHQHPIWGAELLSASPDLSDFVLTIVVQHHERLDGSGYPLGIDGQSLHWLSMIVALVDAYDAQTSHRPYRSARTPYTALSALKKETPGRLDPTLFTSLVHFLGATSQCSCA